MKQFVKYLQSYLIFALPLVLICMLWSSFNLSGEPAAGTNTAMIILWELLSWNLMIWFLSLIVYLCLLLAVPHIQEMTLRRLANLQEADEREAMITAKASRKAYVSTLSLLLFILFFSLFSFNIKSIPDQDRASGKSKSLSIGLNFELFESASKDIKDENGLTIIQSKDFPLSKTGLILLVILWQLIAFNLSARKQKLGEEAYE